MWKIDFKIVTTLKMSNECAWNLGKEKSHLHVSMSLFLKKQLQKMTILSLIEGHHSLT